MADKRIKGITIEFGGDTTELQAALKQPEKDAAALNAELRQVNNSLKFNPDSLEILSQKSTVLESQIIATTDKILIMKNATAEVQQQAQSGDIGEEQYRAFQRELIKTENQLEKLKRESGETSAKLGALGGTTKSAADSAKAFEDAQKKTNETLKQSKEQVSALDIAMGNLIADGFRMAIAAMKEFIKEGIEYSASLTEVQNVVDTVFGAAGGEQIDKWAKSAITNMGLAELTAKDYASTLGTVIDAMGVTGTKNLEMSTTLTQLTSDWASFRDLKPEEVFKKMQSGITGETEAIKSLGIVMTVNNLQRFAQSEGIKKSYKNMTEAEKVTLRYNYILASSSKVMGDFNKNINTQHNQQQLLEQQTRQLSGAFADNFTPAITKALTEVNKYLSENGDKLAGLGQIVALVVTVLTDLLKILTLLPPEFMLIIGGAITLFSAFNNINKSVSTAKDAGKALTGVLGFLNNGFSVTEIKILAVIAVLSILLFLILALKEGSDKAAKSVSALGNTPGGMTGGRGYAKGTANAAKGLALVGEQGPELINFRGGERVLNNHDTNQLLANTGASTGSGDVKYEDNSSIVVHTQDNEVINKLDEWYEGRRLRARMKGIILED